MTAGNTYLSYYIIDNANGWYKNVNSSLNIVNNDDKNII